MKTVHKYNHGTEAIKYEKCFEEYTKREIKRKKKQRAEHDYNIAQHFAGMVMIVIGIVSPFLLNGDGTFSLFALPLGIFLLLTKEKVMTF